MTTPKPQVPLRKIPRDPESAPNVPSGFTLVEVIITMCVIAFGCLAALMMQSAALKGNTMADNLTVATFLAESEVERLKAMTFEDLTAEIEASPTVSSIPTEQKKMDRFMKICSGGDLPACTQYNYSLTTSFYPRYPTSYSHTAEVKVEWRDNTGLHSVSYSTTMTDLAF
jgi:prepilin-type N-terminal cleavage/methylation domain-containing protein